MHLITSAIRIAYTCLVAKPSMPATDDRPTVVTPSAAAAAATHMKIL